MNDDRRDQNTGRFSCPVPISSYPQILMAHGGGGRLMHQLIESMFLPCLGSTELDRKHDGVVLPLHSARIAFTTDSFVVRPLFFPGGNIGKLAVYGTVNDLAMCGAQPRYLSAGLILEEGLPMETLWRVVQSMQAAAAQAGVTFVTGDTKVVDKGKGDGIYVNTSGIGLLEAGVEIHPGRIQQGDHVIVSGDLGRHGIAIMNAREELGLESEIDSDCAPLSELVQKLLGEGIRVHCLRDLTRGGLASALIEIAEAAQIRIQLEEVAIPVQEEVRGACEILGLEPLYVANEGRFVAFVDHQDSDRAMEILASHDLGIHCARVGHVSDEGRGLVVIRSAIGINRIVDMMSGEQLPRIC